MARGVDHITVTPGYVVFRDPGYTDDQLLALKDGALTTLRNKATGLVLVAYATHKQATAAAIELQVLGCERVSLCDYREGAIQTLKRWQR